MATTIIPFTSANANAMLRKPLFDEVIDESEHDEIITHLHSILKKHMRETDEIHENAARNKIARCITGGILMLFYLPTIICNLYYASTDNSCINNTNPDFKLNLYDFLYVDAWASITVIFVIIIHVLYNNKNNILLQLYNIFIHCYSAFIFIWAIMGCIIFMLLLDTQSCESSIYKYVFVLLIIKCIIQVFNVMRYINMYKGYINKLSENNNLSTDGLTQNNW
jgi:hypothetical protein